MGSIIDISRSLHNGMAVWPGDEPFVASWTGRIAAGDTCNVGRVSSSLHCGTHLDSPYHIDDAGTMIADADGQCANRLDPFIGDAQVVSVIGVPAVTVDDLRPRLRSTVRRVLLRTDSFPIGQFNRKYSWLSSEAARLLVAHGVVLVGIDTPSVDPFDSERLETHRTLAAAGVYILEGLELSSVNDGMYELIALPLRLSGMDASPVRAVLRRSQLE